MGRKVALNLILILAATARAGTDEAAYRAEVGPILARCCHECHAGDRVEGDLDLAAFADWSEASKHPRAWQKVAAMLDGGQMPPEDAKRQPTDAEQARLKAWVHTYLAEQAKAHAGDPGRVVLRRLGNAEYTYTLRELTGIDSLDPAREFPVDGAAGEGFTNTGNALVMSPALVTKYLDAAKAVAAHAVLLPDGFRFSPTTTPNDWTNEALAAIRAFYRDFTDPGGGNAVVVQGLVFQTNQGGRLPLEKYLAATLLLRDDPTADLATVARERGLSGKYLATLYRRLADERRPSPPLDRLWERWRAAAPGDARALAEEVEAWQARLWRFNIVGHIGKVGGPTSWIEPVTPAGDPPAGLDEYRDLFPAALCYDRIVPIDEAVTLTLYHREDGPLRRLMLDNEQEARLDRLWDELRFVSRDAIKLVDAFTQILEYASQDADPRVFEPMRRSILDRAEAFRRQLVAAEPKHLDALLRFASLAYRRPLADAEALGLRGLYSRLRVQGMTHDEAFRLTLARVLVAPAFLYKAEVPAPGLAAGPASDWEMASRLSYFLWSSPPDSELRSLAEAGRLRDPDVLAAQARRMLGDAKVRRLATEFACQWLHVYDFDQLDEKSERLFPSFVPLRGAMYEETVRFLADLFGHDRSVLDVLDADHTFLNEALAAHYEIPGVVGPEWRRVDGLKARGRGGILAQATTLAKQSGASRTSPTLRGNWIGEVLLGDRLPRPPKGVATLPDDESTTDGLTVRQLVERHASDPKCSACHARIDPLGFALEAFDPVGRLRSEDLGGRPIDVRAEAIDGATFAGLDGLRGYLLTARRDAFTRQFCRKLLGYALGRSVQLSDEPVLAEMARALQSHGHAVGSAIEVVVRSRPFRDLRGRDVVEEEE